MVAGPRKNNSITARLPVLVGARRTRHDVACAIMRLTGLSLDDICRRRCDGGGGGGDRARAKALLCFWLRRAARLTYGEIAEYYRIPEQTAIGAVHLVYPGLPEALKLQAEAAVWADPIKAAVIEYRRRGGRAGAEG